MQNPLIQIGKGVFTATGWLHDKIRGLFPDSEPVMSSTDISANEGSQQTAAAGTFISTLWFYLGGVTLVWFVILLVMYLMRKKKRSDAAKKGAATRRANKARRRYTYRRKRRRK